MTDEHIDLVSEPEEDSTADGNGAVSELDQLRLELDEAKNRALRSLADLENFRARSNRQAAEERKYANVDLIRELLPIWDNIGRALEAVDQTHNLESLTEGVRMVYKQFLDVFQKFHCEEIEAKFQPFDPNFHASVAKMPSEDYPTNTVIEVVQTGFKIYDRIVRPSQVVLSKGTAEN